jgi:phosphate acetyltransferase/phosphate butyryltransferase
MEFIENRTFDEIKPGESASLVHRLTQEDILTFAAMSGDVNPAHVDQEYARSDAFHKVIAHGMWGGTLISTLLGTRLPGPGTIYLGQTLTFKEPVTVGDTITVTITVTAKDPERHRLTLDCRCVNQKDHVVIAGTAQVIAPTEKVRRPRVVLPEVRVEETALWYEHLIERTRGLPPVRTAIVHPVDQNSILGAVEAVREGLIVPVFVGPEAKMRAAAESAGVNLRSYEVIPCAHSHEAAATAVALARAGKVDALMKGSLHTDELLHEVMLPTTGLRTGRRISHVFALAVPSYPRPLLLTDAAVNIAPDLDDKRDIVQNVIDLAHILGIDMPRVALLSAVEMVSSKLPSTLDAAALCKMADRKQITGAVLDGPLAFDNAVSEEAARNKGIDSPVAGQADILVVPDLEAGNMLAKQLEYLAGAQAAGIVLGARVPIALTSRVDKPLSRMESCAIASLLSLHRKEIQV